jgi:hypothetical protein
MGLFPDLKRLRSVKDVSLLAGHPFVTHESTLWHVAAFTNPGPVFVTDRSVTVTVISNRLLTWHRTFTRDGFKPPELVGKSKWYVHEWIPAHAPSVAEREGYSMLGSVRRKGISWLDTENHVSKWSDQAKRHLKTFKKTPGLKIRAASLSELIPAYARSQVPDELREGFIQEATRHIAAHPDAIDVMVVEHETLGIIAGFVGANNDDARQSLYLLGFFVPEAVKMQPMMGLFDWWHTRAKSLGYVACNFGNMVGPKPILIDSMIGFSNFKTHFGVTRLWQPGNYWKFSRQAASRGNVIG